MLFAKDVGFSRFVPIFCEFYRMSKTKAWLSAFRLRTLPLALSSIALGSLLSAFQGTFNWAVMALAITTTIFLQVLSNLANDYGDGIKGTDNENRIGPARAIQSGSISVQSMKRALYLFSALSLVSGLALIWIGLADLNRIYIIGFLALGILAIAAAIKYTVGKTAYGYHGLGDVFVFLFFGITGVLGTYFLHTHTFDPLVLLPAATLGFLSAGVLNLNNMRDRVSDAQSGKRTLVVLLGGKKAKVYHLFLLVGALGCAVVYTLFQEHSLWQWLYLITVPLLLLNAKAVISNQQPAELDPQLKKLALTTLLFALTFGFGLLI